MKIENVQEKISKKFQKILKKNGNGKLNESFNGFERFFFTTKTENGKTD